MPISFAEFSTTLQTPNRSTLRPERAALREWAAGDELRCGRQGVDSLLHPYRHRNRADAAALALQIRDDTSALALLNLFDLQRGQLSARNALPPRERGCSGRAYLSPLSGRNRRQAGYLGIVPGSELDSCTSSTVRKWRPVGVP
jgi:hypothetical protein